jgi:hypothetical protein
MIQLSEEQENSNIWRDYLNWNSAIAKEWYAPDNPFLDYPTDLFMTMMREVYFTCHKEGITRIDWVSLLGFDVLRADAHGYDAESLGDLMHFFLDHAHVGNVAQAHDWIELQLDGKN